MKKWIHRVVIVVCVVLAGALIPFWSRSYNRYDRLHWIEWQEQGDLVSLHLSGFDMGMGCVQYVSDQMIWTNDPAAIQQMQIAAGRFQPGGRPYRSTRPPRGLVRSNGDSLPAALGFEYRRVGPDEISADRMEIAIPFWAIFCAIMAYPMAHYIRGILNRHKADRQTHSLCPRCGEPLSASATHCACCDRPVVVVSESGI